MIAKIQDYKIFPTSQMVLEIHLYINRSKYQVVISAWLSNDLFCLIPLS